MYGRCSLEKVPWDSWACHFLAEPSCRFLGRLLCLNKQINRGVEDMITWKIDKNSHLDTDNDGEYMDAVQNPQCMAPAARIEVCFNFFAPSHGRLDPLVSSSDTFTDLDRVLRALSWFSSLVKSQCRGGMPLKRLNGRTNQFACFPLQSCQEPVSSQCYNSHDEGGRRSLVRNLQSISRRLLVAL